MDFFVNINQNKYLSRDLHPSLLLNYYMLLNNNLGIDIYNENIRKVERYVFDGKKVEKNRLKQILLNFLIGQNIDKYVSDFLLN